MKSPPRSQMGRDLYCIAPNFGPVSQTRELNHPASALQATTTSKSFTSIFKPKQSTFKTTSDHVLIRQEFFLLLFLVSVNLLAKTLYSDSTSARTKQVFKIISSGFNRETSTDIAKVGLENLHHSQKTGRHINS